MVSMTPISGQSNMTTEFLQRQIERLLQQAADALDRLDWQEVRSRAEAVLRLDPDNADARGLLMAAESTPDIGRASPELVQGPPPAPASPAGGRNFHNKSWGLAHPNSVVVKKSNHGVYTVPFF